jgi:pimeloyl-ACP methyl ester carboxylesterase
MKNSHLIILRNTGHFTFIESPAEFFKAVSEFLRSPAGPVTARR